MSKKIVPKEFWSTSEEAKACLKEWQERLDISDWHIHLIITTEVPEECIGYCSPNLVNRTAIIHIADAKSARWEGGLQKNSQEWSLIHELLHCVIPYFNKKDETIESALFTTYIHETVERLSRALFCAKYDLKQDWFMKEK